MRLQRYAIAPKAAVLSLVVGLAFACHEAPVPVRPQAKAGQCDHAGRQIFGMAPLPEGGAFVGGALLTDERPAWPRRQQPSHGGGEFKAEVLVGPDGLIRDVWVLREPTLEPPWPELTESLVEGIKRRRYAPATVNGAPVPRCLTSMSLINFP